MDNKDTWRGRPVEIRQRYLTRDLLVPHPSFSRVHSEILRSAKRVKQEGKGRAILVLAGSGAGKTYLAKTFRLQRPENHSGNVSHIPVVVFSVPVAPTQKSLGSELLRALYDPKPRSGSAQELLHRAVWHLCSATTEIVFIDNVQDIPERRRAGGVMQLGNWIRDLIDTAPCLVVLLGTPAAVQVTEANAQLRRRVAKKMQIDYFSIDSRHSLARFIRFLHELDRRLPLAEICNLGQEEIAKKVYWATFGIMDFILQLIGEAVTFAVAEGRERISEADLEKAFNFVFQDAGCNCNSFSPNGPSRVLDKEGEPFHNWFDDSNPRLPLGKNEEIGVER